MMLPLKRIILISLFLIAALHAVSINPIVITIAVRPPYYPRIRDYTDDPGKVMVTIINTNPTGSLEVYLLGSVTGSGKIEIRTDPNYRMPRPLIITAGQPMFVSLYNIKQVFDPDHILLKGITKEEIIANGLPEDQYSLCLQAYDYNTHQPVSVGSPSGCAGITLISVEPPTVLTPTCGDSVSVPTPQNLNFTWTRPPGAPVNCQFNLKIIEKLPGDANANAAMDAPGRVAFFEKTLTTTSYTLAQSDPALGPKKTYAVRVTAIDPAGKTLFTNSGRSQVCSFICKAQPNNAPTPPPKPVKIDTSQLTNNLACTCKAESPDGDIDSSATDIKQYATVMVGKFQMTLVNFTVNKKDGKVSGEGKIPIPFLNWDKVNIRVKFSNISITKENDTLKMMSGVVKAKRTEGMTVMPNFDDPKSGTTPFTMSEVKNIDTWLSNNTSQLISNIGNASADFTMPLGLDRMIDGERFVIALVDFTFTPEQAGFSACMAYSAPEDSLLISLGAKNVCFKDPKSFCGDIFLYLTNDVYIKKLNLSIKGPSKGDSGTYASFTKNGFNKLRLRADYQFNPKLIRRQADNGPVTVSLVADLIKWKDWFATVTIDPFYLTDYNEYKFTLKNKATYDHSDYRNPPGLPKFEIEGKKNFLDTIWYGFIMPELDVTLPEILKKSKSKTPITVQVKNLMLDNQGVTVDVLGLNLLNIGEGNLDGWTYSIDTLKMRLVNSTFINAGFNGRLLLPITNQNKQSELDYKCTLTHKDTVAKKPMAFNFVIKPKATIEVPVFLAAFELFSTSNITITYDTSFRAIATLNGRMSITNSFNAKCPRIKMYGIRFDKLVLQNKKKYLSVDKFTPGVASPQKEAGGFSASVDSVKLVTSPGIGLKFWLKLTLGDLPAMPKASTVLSITAKDPTIDEDGRIVFDPVPDVNLEKIAIDGDMAALKVSGYIQYFHGDDTYGDGFKGGIQAKFPAVNTSIAAALQVGDVNDYKYWYADAMLDMGDYGIPMFPGTTLYGFGGGAYYNMKSDYNPSKMLDVKNTSNEVGFGNSPSGVKYVPQQNSMGIIATLLFGLAKRETFNATVTMKVGFNTSGGIENFTLTGDGRVLSKPNPSTGYKPLGTAHVEINYDFPKETFDLAAQVTIGIAGVSANGALAMHIEPAGFYLKVGRASPEESRITMTLASVLKARLYFEAGNMDLDPLPPPPAEIMDIMAKSGVDMESLAAKRDGLESSGSGLIFGGSLGFDAKGCVTIFCGSVYAGVGFDVSLENYTTDCDGNQVSSGSALGVDGWYAVGQAYAGVSAKIYVDLGITKATIFDAGAGAILLAKLPNPEYFAGEIAGYYDIKIASGNFHYGFEYGKNCNAAGHPLNQLKLIADTDPRANESNNDVEININPQIGTNIEIGKYFTLDDEQDSKIVKRSFRFTQDNIEVSLKTQGNPVGFDKMIVNGNKTLVLATRDFLNPLTDYTLEITATLDEEINGTWSTAKNPDGTPFRETYSIPFKTGKGMKSLSLDDVKYTMPYQNERNFCYAGVAQGLINCWKGASFDKFDTEHKNDKDYTTSFMVRFVPTGTAPVGSKITEVPVTCSGNNFLFDIPTDLMKETIYTVQFYCQVEAKIPSMVKIKPPVPGGGIDKGSMTKIQTSGNILFNNTLINERRLSLKSYQQKLYQFSFRTSKYTDYVDKMRTLIVMAGDFNSKGTKDKNKRIVKAGQVEIAASDKLNTLLTGNFIRHGAPENAYPASFCLYGDELYDVYDVSAVTISNKSGQSWTLKPLLNFKTTCFENWTKSIYDNLTAPINASGISTQPYNSGNISSTEYYAAAMPPLTNNEVMTGVNTSVALAPGLECGSKPKQFVVIIIPSVPPSVSSSVSTLIGKPGNQAGSMINTSSNGYVNPVNVSLPPDPVAESWSTSKQLALTVGFTYSFLMTTYGSSTSNLASTNQVIKTVYGNSFGGGGLSASGNANAIGNMGPGSFSNLYTSLGNTFDNTANVKPVFTQDPCFATNFNGLKRAGAMTGNESVNVGFGK